MIRIIEYLMGRNKKIAANMIADLYFCKGDYWDTVFSYLDDAMARPRGAVNISRLGLLNGYVLPNLTVLCAVELNAFSEPENTPLERTLSWAKNDIEKYLRNRSIPEEYITGDLRNK